MTEVETGVVQLQAEDRQPHQKLGGGEEGSDRELGATDTLILDF